MIRAEATLYRILQEFFENELRGLFTLGAAVRLPVEDAEPEPGRRRSLYGKKKELVHIIFGEYDLSVASPLEAPPLGWAKLIHRNGIVEGVLDSATWQSFGRVIREKQERITAHG